MKQLTKAEEEIMQVLWKLKKSTVTSIIQEMSEPKPAITTISTIVRILESKGLVSHEKVGKGHLYYPLLGKDTYSSCVLKKLLKNYFSGSFRNLILFFAKKNELSRKQVESLFEEIDQNDL